MRVAKETHKFLIGGVCAESAKKMKFFFSPYLTEEYPIWWGDAPMAVYSFLESYDLSDKTIIPFCTSGGTTIGDSVKKIKKLCTDAKVKKGLTANDVSDKRIRKWLKKNKVM